MLSLLWKKLNSAPAEFKPCTVNCLKAFTYTCPKYLDKAKRVNHDKIAHYKCLNRVYTVFHPIKMFKICSNFMVDIAITLCIIMKLEIQAWDDLLCIWRGCRLKWFTLPCPLLLQKQALMRCCICVWQIIHFQVYVWRVECVDSIFWGLFDFYSKTCLKQPLKRKDWFSIQIISKCRSKVLENAPREHSAILLTCIKLPFVFKTFVLPFLSGRLRQV